MYVVLKCVGTWRTISLSYYLCLSIYVSVCCSIFMVTHLVTRVQQNDAKHEEPTTGDGEDMSLGQE